MSTIKFKFDTKKFEKDLNRIIEKKQNEINLKNQIESENENMRLLKDTEKELLKILLSKDLNDYTCIITYDDLPSYINNQLDDLLKILKYSGYCASYNRWLGGAEVTLTPEGINYFEKENEYKETANKPNISIGTINANGGYINFGNVYDSTFNIDNSYNYLEQMIEEKGNEDKDDLKEILEEVKDYIDNICQTRTISKNKGLFNRIGSHLEKYQWFYQSVIELIGNSILGIMQGK